MSETEMTDSEAEAIDRRRCPSLWKTWDGYTPHQRRMRDLWRATRCDMVRETLNPSPSPVVEVSEEPASRARVDALYDMVVAMEARLRILEGDLR